MEGRARGGEAARSGWPDRSIAGIRVFKPGDAEGSGEEGSVDWGDHGRACAVGGPWSTCLDRDRERRQHRPGRRDRQRGEQGRPSATTPAWTSSGSWTPRPTWRPAGAVRGQRPHRHLPGAGIKTISVDTDAQNDTISIDPSDPLHRHAATSTAAAATTPSRPRDPRRRLRQRLGARFPPRGHLRGGSGRRDRSMARTAPTTSPAAAAPTRSSTFRSRHARQRHDRRRRRQRRRRGGPGLRPARHRPRRHRGRSSAPRGDLLAATRAGDPGRRGRRRHPGRQQRQRHPARPRGQRPDPRRQRPGHPQGLDRRRPALRGPRRRRSRRRPDGDLVVRATRARHPRQGGIDFLPAKDGCADRGSSAGSAQPAAEGAKRERGPGSPARSC